MNDTELARLGLTLLPLSLPLPGFERFIASWICRDDDQTFLVDCGPASAAEPLIAHMDHLGLEPGWLLLTHIHMDHAGATGALARRWPGMRIVAHARARAHLIDPTRLQAATEATLGPELASAYGVMTATDADRLFGPETLPEGWSFLATPGHAPHHLTFFWDQPSGEQVCFGGEALGSIGHPSWFLDDAPLPWLRPATPPRYEPAAGAATIGALKNAAWSVFCAAHYGASRDRNLPNRALAQLRLWAQVAAQANREKLDDRAACDLLLAADGELGAWADLRPGAQERERSFMVNSLKGLRRFLEEQPQS